MISIPSEVSQLLQSTVAAFSTCSAEGVPNTVAIAYCKVVSPNQILISDNFFNKTRKNLDQNPHVSVTFWNKENDPNGVGYQIKGLAEVFTSGAWKDAVDQMECNQGQSHKAAILVTVSEIWDLAEPCLISKELSINTQ
jgi:hypothetical protein